MQRRCLLAAAAALPWAAQAHGDAAHASRPAAAPEQKPWGIAGRRTAATRTVEIRMQDTMRFVPEHLAVRQGETLRLRIRNEGAVMHEFVLGTRDELEAHAALMARFPNMAHDEPYMAHVPPGRSGEIVWTFNRAGRFEFACLIAGHFSAGMRGTVEVTATPQRRTP